MTDNPTSEDIYQPRLVDGNAARLIVLSGCSGSGKSSLLAALGRRGFATFEEPGRQIVKEQLHIGGDALPWQDARKFVELAVSRSVHQLISAARTGRHSFFDRGIIDAVSFLEHLALPVPDYLMNAAQKYRYYGKVFMTPPWREIYRNDAERRHGFEDAVANHVSLVGTYQRLGYEIVEIPRIATEARADFVLDRVI